MVSPSLVFSCFWNLSKFYSFNCTVLLFCSISDLHCFVPVFLHHCLHWQGFFLFFFFWLLLWRPLGVLGLSVSQHHISFMLIVLHLVPLIFIFILASTRWWSLPTSAPLFTFISCRECLHLPLINVWSVWFCHSCLVNTTLVFPSVEKLSLQSLSHVGHIIYFSTTKLPHVSFIVYIVCSSLDILALRSPNTR